MPSRVDGPRRALEAPAESRGEPSEQQRGRVAFPRRGALDLDANDRALRARRLVEEARRELAPREGPHPGAVGDRDRGLRSDLGDAPDAGARGVDDDPVRRADQRFGERLRRVPQHLHDGRHLGESERREHRRGSSRCRRSEAQLDAVVADDRLALLVAHGAHVGLERLRREGAVDGHEEGASGAGVRQVLDRRAQRLQLATSAGGDEVHRRGARLGRSGRLRGGAPEGGELRLDAGDRLAHRARGHGRLQV